MAVAVRARVQCCCRRQGQFRYMLAAHLSPSVQLSHYSSLPLNNEARQGRLNPLNTSALCYDVGVEARDD